MAGYFRGANFNGKSCRESLIKFVVLNFVIANPVQGHGCYINDDVIDIHVRGRACSGFFVTKPHLQRDLEK